MSSEVHNWFSDKIYFWHFKYKDFSCGIYASNFDEACKMVLIAHPEFSLSFNSEDGVDWVGNYIGRFPD